MFTSFRLKLLLVTALVASACFVASSVSASHTWFNYHWARTSNPFTLMLGDNVSGSWDPYLTLVSADWSLSSVLDTVVVPGKTNPKNCKPIVGRVEVCNSKYGNNGWLGIASIWASGEHITQGTVKMNDSYFNSPSYNKPEWKRFVMCQEVGHTFGLDHQDENFNNANLNTCMDYTNNPLSNQLPNAHDYDMLETIYAHLDPTSSVSSVAASTNGNEIDHNNQSTWGQSIRTSSDGKASLYVKETKDGKVFTFVIWADDTH
ncbi:MAG: hypothetical protein V4664_01595 [Patescibacteria group bacterium]